MPELAPRSRVLHQPERLERDKLWTDAVAQDAFLFLWESFATRYKGVSNDSISFDLVNEPPGVGQHGMTRDNHADLVRRTVAAIRAVDLQREIAINGLGGGNLAMPELADLDVIQSGRGYQPMAISHYRASWWKGSTGARAPSTRTSTACGWTGSSWTSIWRIGSRLCLDGRRCLGRAGRCRTL